MNIASRLILSSVGLLLPALAVFAAPANDTIANATVISGTSATVSGTNVGATGVANQPGETSPDTNGSGNTVWWKWTSPSSGGSATVTVTTYGIGFDAELKVYSGPSTATLFSQLTAVTVTGTPHGDAGIGFKISFTAAQNTTYFLQFDGNLIGDTQNADFSGNVHTGTVRFALFRGAYSAPTVTIPTLNPQPSSGVATGQTMTFNSGASAASGQTLVYQWYQMDKDGNSVLLTDGTVATGDFAGEIISGSATATLVVNNMPPAGSSGTLFGNMMLVVSNADGSGSVASNSGSMTVFFSNANIDTQPVGTTTSTTSNISAGTTATFTIVADGGPLPSFQWRKGGTNLSNGLQSSGSTVSVANTFDSNTNFNTSVLTITSTSSGDNGSYDCVVKNTTATSNSVTSTAVTLTVTGKANQSAPVISSASSLTYPASYTAAANAGFGALSWALGSGSNTAGASINSSTGLVTYSSAGTFTVKATFAGDGTHNSATSADFTVTVNKASQATLSVSSAATGTFGTAYAATATGGSGTGAVTWALGTGSTAAGAAVTSGGAVTSTGAGTVVVHATKAADTNYLVATSADFTITLGKAAQATLSVNSAATGTFGTAYSATSTGGSGTGALTWALGTGSTAPGAAISSSSGAVTSTGAGTVVINVTKATDSSYLSATSANFTVTLAKATATVTLGTLSATYDGLAHAATATTTPSGKSVTFTYNGSATVPIAGGTYAVVGTISDTNYTGTGSGSLTIAKAPLTVTADSKLRAVGVANPTFTVKYSGFVNNETASSLSTQPTATTAATTASAAGSYPIVPSGGVSSNYSFTYVNGTLTVGQFVISDYNGDGHTDLLWENTAGVDRALWYLNGTGIAGFDYLAGVANEWHIAGEADFNGDGQTDILWENTLTGDRSVWLMDGTSIVDFPYLAWVDPSWHIAAVGDFNGDGQTDILWENAGSGGVDRAIWFLNGTNILGFGYLAGIPPEWHIVGTGDFNGDGKTDIVWEDTLTGARSIWLMDGTNILDFADLGTVGPAWHIAKVADFDGDGKVDLLWENRTTGDRSIWIMNGTNHTSSIYLAYVDPVWHIAP